MKKKREKRGSRSPLESPSLRLSSALGEERGAASIPESKEGKKKARRLLQFRAFLPSTVRPRKKRGERKIL